MQKVHLITGCVACAQHSWVAICSMMEDIVAVKVTDKAGKEHYFMTWGRVFDSVDPEPLLQAITPHVSRFGVKEVSAMSLCPTLRDAAGQPYFYEALFTLSQQQIPYGVKTYDTWCKQIREDKRGA